MFNVGDKVIYSDLSPWETATVVGLKDSITQEICDEFSTHQVKCTPDQFDYLLDFNDGGSPCPVQSDGMREYTPENIKNLLS